jgi:tetratricopeptide (TPR) repeat protein
MKALFPACLFGALVAFAWIGAVSAEPPPATFAPASKPATAPATGEHFSRARELYKEGPAKAKGIAGELDLELKDHPDNIAAYLLKAMVQMGTDEPKAAIKTLDEAAKQDAKTQTIHPEIHYLLARAYFQTREFAAARKALEPYSAFFMRDPDSEARYDKLMAAIEAELKKAESKDGPSVMQLDLGAPIIGSSPVSPAAFHGPTIALEPLRYRLLISH